MRDGLHLRRLRDGRRRKAEKHQTADAPRTPSFWIVLRMTVSGIVPLVLRRADREIDVPGQRLVRDLVGDLDLEPVVTFGERGQRHRLAALQLMARREVELRRQRLRVQALRVRLVEELLRLRRPAFW